ncbi:HD-like signal output (HDOD) domain, no enzymatic activity [Alteromonadaceae bacterium Bs31]|nr:HD-like signal output (HDOD) domain, no enzymatic activity [Alteromonadaceae bacterium Bs31]
MSLLNKVFSKKVDPQEEKQWLITEPRLYTIKDSEEAYYRFLYPKNTEKNLTVPQKLVADMVKASLQKQENRNKAVPRLPSVIPRLLRSLRDPNSSARDYVEIINKDPVMSAAVLKLANSVYFNPIGARIDEIEKAVVKLGIEGIRSVLSAAVMQPIVQRESAYFSHTGQKMWNHSLSCAVACELIADYRKVDKFKVYVMGLVHDIGKITVFSELCKQFKLNEEEVKPGYNAFTPVMKVMAPAVSYWVAKDWELPKEICKAIAEQVNLQAGNKLSPFGHVLYQANMIAECHVTLHHKNESLAETILRDLELPEDLYDKLDMLQREY